MSITLGASTTKTYGGTSSDTTSAITTQASGSTIVVGIAYDTGTFSSLTDSKSNTYTLIGTEGTLSSFGGKTRLYVCHNATGGSSHTFTVAFSGGTVGYPSIFVQEFICSTPGSTDVSAQRVTTSSPYALSSSITTTTANEMLVLFGSVIGSGSVVLADGAGFTNRLSVTDSNTYWAAALFTQAAASAGSYNCSVTETGSGSVSEMSLHVLAIKESAAGVTLTGSAATMAAGTAAPATAKALTGQAGTTGQGTIGPQGITIASVGPAIQYWTASDAWSPTTLSRTVTTGGTLITLGGWWDDTGANPSALPTDSAGTFTAAVNPTTTGSPVRVQVTYQSASAGSHTVTPPSVATSGDGYLSLIEVSGLATSSPLRDSGRTRDYHAPVTPPDSNTIQTITATTAGSSTQVGDLLVAVLVTDPNSTSNSNAQIVVPSGWTQIAAGQNMTDNVGFMAVWKLASASGSQSVTFDWTDANTFVAEAAIASFKSALASSGASITGASMSMGAGTVGRTGSLALSGQAATGGRGSLAPANAKALAGSAATGQRGTLAPALVAALAGLSATAAAGSVTATQGAAVALSGAQASFGAGSLSTASSPSLTGLSATCSAGSVAVEGAIVPAVGGGLNYRRRRQTWFVERNGIEREFDNPEDAERFKRLMARRAEIAPEAINVRKEPVRNDLEPDIPAPKPLPVIEKARELVVAAPDTKQIQAAVALMAQQQRLSAERALAEDAEMQELLQILIEIL